MFPLQVLLLHIKALCSPLPCLTAPCKSVKRYGLSTVTVPHNFWKNRALTHTQQRGHTKPKDHFTYQPSEHCPRLSLFLLFCISVSWLLVKPDCFDYKTLLTKQNISIIPIGSVFLKETKELPFLYSSGRQERPETNLFMATDTSYKLLRTVFFCL